MFKNTRAQYKFPRSTFHVRTEDLLNIFTKNYTFTFSHFSSLSLEYALERQ